MHRIINAFARLLVKVFYSRADGADAVNVIGSVFFMQKILGFNRLIPWPMHFTSKLIQPKKIHLGFRSFPGWSPGCYIQAKNGIYIGNNLRMGPNVGLISANHDSSDYDKWITSDPIRIGDNVWIGMGVVVMPGVTIGDNVIIGANSVVTKNLPSNCVAAGVPCKPLRTNEGYDVNVVTTE